MTEWLGLAGGALAGVVKSHGAEKGYGFICSDAVQGDIYFRNADLDPALAGCIYCGCAVTFKLSQAPDGKPQAREVQVSAEDPYAYAAMAYAYAAAAWKGKGSGKGFPMSPMHMLPQSVPQSGAHLTGMIKSFDPAKGYGFITSVPGISQDIYFKAVGCEAVSKGEQVNFVLNWMKDGQPQGASISRGLSEGELMRGSVKSFNAKNGYGFVCVEGSLRDVYFKQSALPKGLEAAAADGSLVGATVRFVVKLQADGKPQLSDLILEELAPHGAAAAPRGVKRDAAGFAAAPAAKRPRAVAAPVAAVAAPGAPEEEGMLQLAGVIKSFNPQKGYGFISSEDVEGDVWFRRATLPQELQGSTELTGQGVIFGLTHAQDGKAQAGTIEVMGFAFE